MNQETELKALNVAIGYELKEMLGLKVGANGLIKTSWGNKSIEGLGASILAIIEQQKERLK